MSMFWNKLMITNWANGKNNRGYSQDWKNQRYAYGKYIKNNWILSWKILVKEFSVSERGEKVTAEMLQ